MKVQVSLKVLPKNYKTQEYTYNQVNEVIAHLHQTDLKVLVGPSETTLEGEYSEIFKHIEIIDEKITSEKNKLP